MIFTKAKVKVLLAGVLVAGQVVFAETGLIARFNSGGKTDSLVLPNPAMFVPKGQAPTGRIMSGEFTLELTGDLNIELRALYTFHAELDGELELLINRSPVIQSSASGETVHASRPVRLNKGANAVVAKFRSNGGNAQLRLLWSSRNIPHPIPIPGAVFSHDESDPELRRDEAVRKGAFLFRNFRCINCHTADAGAAGEFQMDAPSFEGIGSRLSADWMADFIRAPAKHRAAPHMPELLFGSDADTKAKSIAAYLSTLKAAGSIEDVSAGQRANGEEIFQNLRCSACHTLRGEPAAEGKLSLAHVGQKFGPGALSQFLRNPQAHYRWNPMPNFGLSEDEAESLSRYLLNEGDKSQSRKIDSSLADSGTELVQTTGCLNCHSSTLENRFSARPLAAIAAGDEIERGCLSSDPGSSAPRFTFASGDRDALRSYLRARAGSVALQPVEFALRQLGSLRCAACHDESGTFPSLAAVGGKLKPEWMERLLAGQVEHKPRPWLPARMPAYPAYASGMAAGLAAIHGLAPRTAEEPPVNQELATVGATLISAAGGFSCVACHHVGNAEIALVVESPGVNLVYSGERLLKDFFHRWLLNPIAMDPTTKMPVYFDEQGRSPISDVLEGDAQKQIEAMWQYIRLGEKMPPPPLP